jgi:CRISPR-associated protein Cas1
LLNKRIIGKDDFDHTLNSCLLKDNGRRKVIKFWDERLQETIKHRSLGRSVSYRHLVKLECYKLVKHILDIEEYKPFKAWW